MGAYESFASVYDMFMDNIDYPAWSRYLTGLLKRYGIEDGLVCELGCGTGSMTELLAEAGYDMIGIDMSVEMLEEAQEKKYRSGHDILYLNQDMREFELYGTVRAIISVCDSMNYILTEKDLLRVFRLANNYLDPGGMFIFDMTTEARYRSIGDSVIAENRDDGSFIWENSYDEEKKLNQYAVTFFLPEKRTEYPAGAGEYAEIPEMRGDCGGEDEFFGEREDCGGENGLSEEPEDCSEEEELFEEDEDYGEEQEAPEQGALYRKYEEVHLQKVYSVDTIRRLIGEAGMIFEGVYEAFTDHAPDEKSDRIYVLAREHGKKV